jgi:hypothetical protein
MAVRRIFWGFCINRFGIGPLHYVSSRSDFGFEFADIFVIEKRLPDSPSRRVGESRKSASLPCPFNYFMEPQGTTPFLTGKVADRGHPFSGISCCVKRSELEGGRGRGGRSPGGNQCWDHTSFMETVYPSHSARKESVDVVILYVVFSDPVDKGDDILGSLWIDVLVSLYIGMKMSWCPCGER